MASDVDFGIPLALSFRHVLPLKVLGRTSFLDLALITVFFGFVWWLNESYSVGRLRQERATLLSMTAPDFSSEREARVSLRAHPLAG
jgi:hypothetical protein